MSKARANAETLRTALVAGDVTNANFTGADLEVGKGGTGASTAGAARTALGVVIGTNVLAPDGNGSALTGIDSLPSQSGNTGKFLTTNGSAASWGTVAPAGLTLLSTVTASNSSTVDIETTFNGTYDSYVIMATNVKAASNNQKLKCRFKISGSYLTANYYTHRNNSNSSSSGYIGVNAQNDPDLVIASGLASSNNHHLNFNLYISQPTITNKFHTVHWNGSHIDGNQYSLEASGVGYNQNTGALTGIRFECASGTVEIGTFKLYGVAK